MSHNTQLKRTLQAQQPTMFTTQQCSVQQLICQLQQTIVQTSESIKATLQQFQLRQLHKFKEELFDTQLEFIKVRAERNQDVLKGKIMKEKLRVEGEFEREMKRAMDVSEQYDQMKRNMKALNEDEKQLLLEIRFMKKKIQKAKQQGKQLDQQLTQMQINQTVSNKTNHSTNTKPTPKLTQQTQLFKQIINKCQTKHPNQLCFKTSGTQGSKAKMEQVENSEKTRERKIRRQIENMKEYVKEMPLELNYFEGKLWDNLVGDGEREGKDEGAREKDEVGEDANDESKENMKKENIQQNEKQVTPTGKPNTSSKILKTSNIKFPSITSPNPNSPLALSTYCKFRPPAKPPLMDKTGNSFLPKSSASLEQILSDEQVKRYLYGLLLG